MYTSIAGAIKGLSIGRAGPSWLCWTCYLQPPGRVGAAEKEVQMIYILAGYCMHAAMTLALLCGGACTALFRMGSARRTLPSDNTNHYRRLITGITANIEIMRARTNNAGYSC